MGAGICSSTDTWLTSRSTSTLPKKVRALPTVLLMLANSFPLNSTMEYTAPLTSFSARLCSFPGIKPGITQIVYPKDEKARGFS